jgi:hypothetical protein
VGYCFSLLTMPLTNLHSETRSRGAFDRHRKGTEDVDPFVSALLKFERRRSRALDRSVASSSLPIASRMTIGRRSQPRNEIRSFSG